MDSKETTRLLVATGFLAFALLACGCAHHRAQAALCPRPAKVVGTDPGAYGGGWVLVRGDLDPQDTAARIAKIFHVRTQSLMYVHGFSVFPMPEGQDERKFLCDKALVEVHYDPVQGVAAR